VLVIEHRGSDRFIQFVKSSTAAGRLLGFRFHDAPWSRSDFEPVRAALTERGFEPLVSDTGDATTPRLVGVEFSETDGEQIAKAVEVAQLTFQTLGLSESDRYSSYHLRRDPNEPAVLEA